MDQVQMISKFFFNSVSLCHTPLYTIIRLTFNAHLFKVENVRKEIMVSASYYPPLGLTL